MKFHSHDYNLIKIKFLKILNNLWVMFFLLSLIISILSNAFFGSVKFKTGFKPNCSINDFDSYISDRINYLMKKYGIPGCNLAIVHDGDIVLTNAYGYADIGNGIPLTIDTPMRIQSITKSVTAWAVMKIVEDGLIDLDTPISQYFHSWNFPKSPYRTELITVRNLLSHTSGLPLGDVFTIYNPTDAMPTLEEKLTLEAVLAQSPNEGFIYSNVGFNLLELLIEEVTGRDFAEYMENEVLLPLKMTRSFFNWGELPNPVPPKGYDLKGNEVLPYVYPEKGSGGLFASIIDIANFTLAGMKSNPVISLDSIEQMYTIQSSNIGIYGLVFDGYGFGHYIENLKNGMISVSHGGQGTGIMTHFQAVPETKDAIIILTNSQKSWPMISNILKDWAEWESIGHVGMEKIIWGEMGIGIITGMILSISIIYIIKILTPEIRKVLLNNKRLLRIQSIYLLISIIINMVIIWCVCQKYLFITSVFPIMSLWLGTSLYNISIVFLIYGISLKKRILNYKSLE